MGGMFGLFFSTDDEINSFQQVMECNQEHFNLFFHGMLKEGVYLAPSAYESGFVSSSHSEDDINATINAAEKIFASAGLAFQ